MKKPLVTICLIFIIVAAYAKTVQLKNFEELMKALNQGEQVRVIAHYENCKLISDNVVQERSPNAIGGMMIDVYEYFAPLSIGNPKAFLVFSHSKMINYSGFIYNYAKFKVLEDNKVQITAQYVNPQSFDLEMDEKFFGEINDGENKGAIYFYMNN
ncbi:MAG: hypothetical protein K9N07_00035 [Candidatus Cloacimonetes bacterium]|nr:hypothetical protein [Candidatus Cloacimonadota bacterium]